MTAHLKVQTVWVEQFECAYRSGHCSDRDPGSITTAAGVTAPTDVASIHPASGEKVGVAMPVTLTFAQSITNRAAAERSVAIASPATPAGSFTWLNDRVLQWNPKGFWPAHSSIIVSAGGAKTTFETGAAVVGVADIDAHTFPSASTGRSCGDAASMAD